MSLSTTVVINCAGIGSRLGLGTTKALLEIEGKPLIHWQLENLYKVEDLRIVVGFEANKLIETILKLRKNVTFIYNHEYFFTKTMASLALGSSYANDYVISLDGDLIINPDDINKCLNPLNEYVACSEIYSDEPVLVTLNDKKEVVNFSRKKGKLEWTGVVCLERNKLNNLNSDNKNNHVYQHIEKYLPIKSLKIRALDIDTINDYKKAIEFIRSW